MLRCYCFIVFLLLCSEVLYSQSDTKNNVLIGILADSTDVSPIGNASLSVLDPLTNAVISGGVTNKDGRFRIEYAFEGEIDLAIGHIGYNKRYIYGIAPDLSMDRQRTLDLGVILLSPTVLSLDPIRVSGISRSYQVGIDKNSYKVSKNTMLRGKTGADALRAIPAVNVDIDGVISLRGDRNVTLLVNGILSGMASGDRRSTVETIPAATIDHIEIISNPSADYDPGGMGGIINIVTLNSNIRDASSLCKLSFESNGGYDGLIATSLNREKLGLSITASGKRENQRLRTTREYMWDYPGLSLTSTQKRIVQESPITGTINISGDYRISKSQSLNFGSNLTLFNGTTFDTIIHLYPVEYRMTSDNKNRGWAFDLRGGHNWKSSSLGKNIRTSAFFSQTGDHENDVNDRNVNGINSNDHSHIHKNDVFRNFGFKTAFFIALEKNTDVNIGADLYAKTMKRELEYLHLPFGFDHEETVGAMYIKLNYSGDSPLKFDTGARIETSGSKGSVYKIELPGSHHHLDTSNVFMSLIDTSIASSPFTQSKITFYPSARLWYKFTEQASINLSYSRRTNRPRRPSINPFPVSMIDEYHIRVGNPLLKPELIDVVELGLSQKQDNLQLYGVIFFKKIDNMIQWHSVDFVQIDALQYEVISTINSGRGMTLGSELQLFYSYRDKLSLNLSYNNWNTDASGNNIPALNGKSSGYFFNASVTTLVKEHSKVELSGYFRGPMEVPTGGVDPSYYLDLAIERKIPKTRLRITLSFKDIFDTQSYKLTTNESMYNLSSQQAYSQSLISQKWTNYRSVILTLDYDFGLDNERIMNKLFKRTDSNVNIDYDY